MEQLVKINPQQNLHIVDNDHYFALRVKHSLGKKFGEGLLVNIFRDVESSIESMKTPGRKPNVVLMDHEQNKKLIKENGEYAVETIKRISPDTRIIILSEEKSKDSAARTLAHGVQDFVIKDQFAIDHIYSAVENCLLPSKV